MLTGKGAPSPAAASPVASSPAGRAHLPRPRARRAGIPVSSLGPPSTWAQGDYPDVASSGEAVYVSVATSSETALHRLSLDGETLSVRHEPGGGWSRLAWHPELSTVMLTLDGEAYFFREDGSTAWMDSYYHPSPHIDDVAAVPGGFLVFATPRPADFEPVGIAQVDWDSLGLTWSSLSADGYATAIESATNAEGFATRVSHTLFGSDAKLFDLSDPSNPKPLTDFDLSTRGTVLGLADLDGDLYRLIVTAPFDPSENWRLSIERVTRDDQTLWTVKEEPLGTGGHLELFGEDLVVTMESVSGPGRISIAAFAPQDGPPLRGERVLTSGSHTAGWSRIARTNRGLAVVWAERQESNEELRTKLQLVDCCPMTR